jgi:hypothetical protein
MVEKKDSEKRRVFQKGGQEQKDSGKKGSLRSVGDRKEGTEKVHLQEK